MNGTSNVHGWKETLGKATGSATMNWQADGSFTLSYLSINMEARSLKSEKGSIMDNKTYEAILADKFPNITFKMTSVKSIVKNGSSFTVSTKGDLGIAGATKNIDITATTTSLAGGKVQFEGSKSFNMSDFGISAPTAMMGAMRTGDQVTIKFKVVFQPN